MGNLLDIISKSVLGKVTRWGADSEGFFPAVTETTDDIAEANVFSSQRRDAPEWHRIALDIDRRNVYVRESSTPGNYHLVIDSSLSWDQYKKLLAVLHDLNIIEKGYFEAAIQRKATYLRLPWVKK